MVNCNLAGDHILVVVGHNLLVARRNLVVADRILVVAGHSLVVVVLQVGHILEQVGRVVRNSAVGCSDKVGVVLKFKKNECSTYNQEMNHILSEK